MILTTSHALGTIVSAMGPYGALGALGTSAMTYLLLQLGYLPQQAQRGAGQPLFHSQVAVDVC